MIVELQLDADTFLKSFREQMRKALLCELTEDVLDLNPSDSVPGEPFIIVGYEVGQDHPPPRQRPRPRPTSTVALSRPSPSAPSSSPRSSRSSSSTSPG